METVTITEFRSHASGMATEQAAKKQGSTFAKYKNAISLAVNLKTGYLCGK